jgi:hypothetical protein
MIPIIERMFPIPKAKNVTSVLCVVMGNPNDMRTRFGSGCINVAEGLMTR